MKIMNVLLGLLLLCVACNESEKKTRNGMKYTVVKTGNGVAAKPNEILVFNFRLKDSKDSVWTDTYKEGVPGMIMIQDTSYISQEDGMVQMMRMVSPGDSIHVNFGIKEFFETLVRRPVPLNLDSTLKLTYYFKIDSITDRAGAMAMQTRIMEEKQKVQFEKDIAAIDAYLAEKKIVALKAESGLRYVVKNAGTGENGKPGQIASVNYAGYMLDGTLFDTSIKSVAMEKGVYNAAREPYAPYDVTIDQSSVIKGWHEALKLMNKGAQITVYIPSTLAYGQQQRSEVIKPNSILVFDMEVVDLK